ncbi:hypothetical protein CXB51_005367 [Gossypium anomalum]|uniref:Uncharacterized protein n=1 Tax=Gossypium anomalum TaxID=47600 RepID=A0A8J5ZFK9_9ROSI|nr:hypothetical protein CXB51_005367 [Gossypium anomalum]
MSSKTADSMRWHNDQRTDDGLLRHPTDSLAWKSFDSKFPSFASDPQNVRLGLAADGFNPFKIMSTSYSTWPVVLVPYNFKVLSRILQIRKKQVVNSSNVPETLDEPTEFQTESGGMRRGQGRTLLKDLYDLNPVERVKVSRNSHGQPVGSEARLLTGYLGIIAQNDNMLPINYESWHHMPGSNKNQALDNIKERFALEVSDDYIKKELGTTGKMQLDSGIQRNERTVSELEQAADKNKNSRTRQGREEKLKEKNAEYEAVASTDRSGVTLTQYFGSGSQQYMPSGSQAQAEVQRLRDQIAQMQANTVEQIAEVQRKYEELQQQLRAEAAEREAAAAAERWQQSRAKNTMSSSYSFSR